MMAMSTTCTKANPSQTKYQTNKQQFSKAERTATIYS